MDSASTDSAVPFLDLKEPHVSLEEQLIAVLRRSLTEACFIGGPMVERFEAEFAEYVGTDYCIGVGSGTDALRFALIATGIRPGDAVVTVPNTFIATTEAISQAGAEPFFVDVLQTTRNMDCCKLQRFLESECHRNWNGDLVTNRGARRLRAIVPVHLYGQPADMGPIMELANIYDLTVIEDACQAHGAEYFLHSADQWQKAGAIGHAAAFSFYPGKNLGACGEGGAVTTNDPGIASEIRRIRDHGQDRKYYHKVEGYNGRLDSIQAGFLSVKLAYLDGWNEARRAAAAQYGNYFGAADNVRPVRQLASTRSVYHLYVVSVPQRDTMRELLLGAGVDTGIHYPLPLHLQPAYCALGYRPGDFPVAEGLAAHSLSIPMYPQLKTSQIQYVAEAVLRLSEKLTKVTDGDHEYTSIR